MRIFAIFSSLLGQNFASFRGAKLQLLLQKIITDTEDRKSKNELIDELIRYCQVIFKSEWEKVKIEAGETMRENKRIKKKLNKTTAKNQFENFLVNENAITSNQLRRLFYQRYIKQILFIPITIMLYLIALRVLEIFSVKIANLVDYSNLFHQLDIIIHIFFLGIISILFLKTICDFGLYFIKAKGNSKKK